MTYVCLDKIISLHIISYRCVSQCISVVTVHATTAENGSNSVWLENEEIIVD